MCRISLEYGLKYFSAMFTTSMKVVMCYSVWNDQGVGQHSHESGPNGPATWAGPYGPSKYYGILWYVAVIYGMETDRFVSRITIIQVICHHRHFPNSHLL